MTEQEPIRLFDPSSGADERVRRCLEAGRDELPTEDQLAALAARLGPLFGPGGTSPPPSGGATGGGGGAAAAGAGLTGKALVAAGVAIALAAGGLVWRSVESTERVPVVAAPVAPPRPAPVVEEVPRGLDPAEAPPSPTPAPGPHARPRTTPAERDAGRADAATAPADPEAEVALVRSAQQALRAGAAARALELAADHARRFPSGLLAQEREVVAIESLARLGRTAEARARADAFRRRWPRSAHVRRLDVILGTPP